MESLKLDCEIVTPLLLSGAYANEPDLRAPSIKGTMRYWWRAVNVNLDLKKLSNEEERHFGTSKGKVGRSKFNLRINTHKLDTNGFNLIYYKNYPPVQGFSPGQNISIVLTSPSDANYYADVLKLSLLLGDLGRRSRRGFGSLKPSDQNYKLEDILELINRVGSNNYEINKESKKIVLNSGMGRIPNYPYLKEVMIGSEYNSWNDLLDTVALASHQYCDDSLGSISSRGKDRLASPIYVSVLKSGNKYCPIISTLNTVFKDKYKQVNDTAQTNFKVGIL